MIILTWDEVLERSNDIIGGDLECVDSGLTMRGPIKSIQRRFREITIIWEWWAYRLEGKWKYGGIHNDVKFTPTEKTPCTPFLEKEGNEEKGISFKLVMAGNYLIYFKSSGLVLNSTEVEGFIRA